MSAHPTTHSDDSQTFTPAADGAAWLVEHGDALYRFARFRVGDRELAEDLVQDAFLAALESRDQFQGRASVRTWLMAILRPWG